MDRHWTHSDCVIQWLNGNHLQPERDLMTLWWSVQASKACWHLLSIFTVSLAQLDHNVWFCNVNKNISDISKMTAKINLSKCPLYSDLHLSIQRDCSQRSITWQCYQIIRHLWDRPKIQPQFVVQKTTHWGIYFQISTVCAFIYFGHSSIQL